MASKLIALFSILALMTLCSLENFWFTYGIWPKSWFSFFGFFAITVILMTMLSKVLKDIKQE